MDRESIILLVEDNEMDIALTLDAFRQVHLSNRIEICNNGEDALNYMFGRGNYTDRKLHPLPDLILLDLKMPRISGLDVLREIKSTEKLKRIPVIVLTSSKDEGDRAMSYDMGANSYLVKPISFNGFLEVVKSITNYWLTLNIEPPLE
ncbi:response regulator [Tenuifilum thalassicum]|uniref:Response regulator n=1 Tax=Tenuifilum thalassicum TaxID=2590900 RepID=A0A7D4BDT3_9BACT|nr:response regulator [Tenuifilum thalassicum]QKG80063.1 response regulator [Tenuifilum thalassicum]